MNAGSVAKLLDKQHDVFKLHLVCNATIDSRHCLDTLMSQVEKKSLADPEYEITLTGLIGKKLDTSTCSKEVLPDIFLHMLPDPQYLRN